jgi:hypothetical protein
VVRLQECGMGSKMRRITLAALGIFWAALPAHAEMTASELLPIKLKQAVQLQRETDGRGRRRLA